MKIFTKKKWVQKVIILISIVLSLSFIMPTYSSASFGGVLMGPIIDFISGLGDAVLSALQFFMYDGTINVSSAAGSAAEGALTIINPFDSFLLLRSNDEFDALLEKYDMNVTSEDSSENDGEVDIEINVDEFDKGWLGWLPGSLGDKDYGVPIIKYTPEKIFGNKVPALDANFINPKDWSETDGEGSETSDTVDGETMNEHSITRMLHSTIATWYVALRNLALVVLLSVLLYVGIRMVISSSAGDKSKYKQMLVNWLVAVCILFFLHYVMSFILSITGMITDGLTGTSEVIVQVTGEDAEDNFQFKTDLTGLVRFQIQYKDLGARLIYLIFYIALVIYTVMFTWVYVKRAITMAFLTLMAPLIAITYPIDKIGDGQAQAFSIWLKEFIFNALLQPFHLIIYTIFLGAASDIVVRNPIYAILFLAFIIPAEKLLRKMFGFEKTSTVGGMSSALGVLGGAAAFKTVGNLISKGAKGLGDKGKKGIRVKGSSPSVSDAFGNTNAIDAGEGSTDTNNIRTADTAAIAGAGSGTPPDMAGGGQPSGPEPAPDGFSQRNGLWVPGYVDTSVSTNNQQLSQNTQERTENLRRDNWAWEEDDTRSMGEYLRDGISGTWQDSSARASLLAGRDRLMDTTGGRFVRRGTESIRTKAAKLKNAKNDFVQSIPKPLRNTARGTWAVARRAGGAGLRAAGAVTMAGVGATFGLAAGIAGDDLEDVIRYGAAGAALGAAGLPALGRGIAGSARSTVRSVSDTYTSAAYGPKEAALREQTREWTHSAENENAMIDTFRDINDGRAPTTAEKRQMMNAGAEYYNAGITETKDIQKGMKLENQLKKEMASQGVETEDAESMARKQAMVVAKLAADYTPDKLRDDKNVTKLQDDITRQLVKGGTEARAARAQAEKAVQLVKEFKGVS